MNLAPEQGSSTAFVVLTPHCGAKFVQCETERCLLFAAGRLATTDSRSEIEQRGWCQVSIKHASCKQQPEKEENVKRRKACELE